MAEEKKIKTALEIAMERVSAMKVDPEELKAAELKRKSHLVMGEFLKDPAFDFSKKIKSLDLNKNDQAIFLSELVHVLLSNVQLPSSLDAKEWMERCLKALIEIRGSSIKGPVAQAKQLIEQYLKQRTHIEDQLKEQFQQALAQMESQMGARMGARIKLAPEANPEFVKRRNEIFARLDAQFSEALEELKSAFFEI